MASGAPSAGWEAGGASPLLPERLERGLGLHSVGFFSEFCLVFLIAGASKRLWLLQSGMSLCDHPKTLVPLVMQDTLRSPCLLL